MGKKVLFSFVGEQDPVSNKTQEEGSIVTLYRYIKPDCVYLFPTAKAVGRESHTEDNARETLEWIKGVIDPDALIYIRPLSVNPVSYEEILGAMYREIPVVLNELKVLGEDVEIHLNCSSGTPQLKSCWLILAYGRHIPNPRLWQVYNPQYVSPEKRVEEIRIDFIEENAIIDRIYKYAEMGFFGVVAVEALRLKEITVNSFQKYRAQLINDIFSAYEKWDLIKYKEAHDKISRIYREYQGSRDLEKAIRILEKQKEYLRHLIGELQEETIYNLVDLYFNAKRRLDRLDFTETLARFWRIYEGTLYLYMRKNYKIEPANLTQSNDRKLGQEIIGFLNPNYASSPIGIYNAERVLMEKLNDRRYRAIMDTIVEVDRGVSRQKLKMKDILTELRNKRNSSIVAHGMKPVEELDAKNAIKLCEELLEKMILKDEDFDLQDYPFKKDEYISLLNNLLNFG